MTIHKQVYEDERKIAILDTRLEKINKEILQVKAELITDLALRVSQKVPYISLSKEDSIEISINELKGFGFVSDPYEVCESAFGAKEGNPLKIDPKVTFSYSVEKAGHGRIFGARFQDPQESRIRTE